METHIQTKLTKEPTLTLPLTPKPLTPDPETDIKCHLFKQVLQSLPLTYIHSICPGKVSIQISKWINFVLSKYVMPSVGFGHAQGHGWLPLKLDLDLGLQVLPIFFIYDGNLKCRGIYETNVFKPPGLVWGAWLFVLFAQRHFCLATL